MARPDALKRIAKLLFAKRQELRKRLGMELEAIGPRGGVNVGDSAEAAFKAGGVELASQMAALEAKELAAVELALTRMQQGQYGICYGCECKIPIARLNALPYSILCISCQRESEKDQSWMEDRIAARSLLQPDSADRETHFAELEAEFTRA